MPFFVSKTFDILGLTAEPKYNFYASDELYNVNSLIYNKQQYAESSKTLFIKNNNDLSLAARYIKLKWESVNMSKDASVLQDVDIIDSVDDTSNIKDTQELFEMFNMNCLTDKYYEYFSDLSAKKIVTIGTEGFDTNTLITSSTTEKCFSVFTGSVNSELIFTRKDLETPVFYLPDSDVYGGKIGYVGCIIAKEVETKDGFVPYQFIVCSEQTAFGGDNTFYDYYVSYNKKYRYRIAPIFRYVYRNKFTKTININGVETVCKGVVEQNKENKKEFYIGCFSDWVEAKIIDFELPNYPEDIRVLPDKETTKKFILLWSHVEQFSKDIKHYTILRRLNENFSEWEKIYETKNYHYIEYIEDAEPENFKNHGYIYAIISTDVHGNVSRLSRQILVKYEQKGNKNTVTAKHFMVENKELNETYKLEEENEYILCADEHVHNIKILPGEAFDSKTYELKLISGTGDIITFKIAPKIIRMIGSKIPKIVIANKDAMKGVHEEVKNMTEKINRLLYEMAQESGALDIKGEKAKSDVEAAIRSDNKVNKSNFASKSLSVMEQEEITESIEEAYKKQF